MCLAPICYWHSPQTTADTAWLPAEKLAGHCSPSASLSITVVPQRRLQGMLGKQSTSAQFYHCFFAMDIPRGRFLLKKHFYNNTAICFSNYPSFMASFFIFYAFVFFTIILHINQHISRFIEYRHILY